MRNIVDEGRKILVIHPSYRIRFIKRQTNEVAHELAMVALLFSNFYSIDHIIPNIEHLIHNEIR